MSAAPAVISLGARTGRLAARIAAALPGATIHAPAAMAGPADVRFTDLRVHLQALFAHGTPIVGLCATGILIRLLAPVLGDKQHEPPVLAVAADGSAVVPLLGGHHGAVALARRLATTLEAAAAVTTAGDLVLGLALDEPPPGWTLADPGGAKAVAARLLDGAGARVVADPGLDTDWPALPQGDDLLVRLTTRRNVEADLVYHPRTLVLGVGCERDAAPEALIDHARRCLAAADLAPAAVACVVSLELKAAEPAVHALAAALDVPARFFAAAELAKETERLTSRSEPVHAETGVWGVAEAAALAAVGPAGHLLLPKQVGPRVTCAVAAAPQPIDAQAVGRPRGRLALVGLGPGDAAWRTRDADRLLAEADDLVGYGLYLDLVGEAARGKRHHPFPLGAEAERCRFALDLAGGGRSVALVCSGDPGIYALASLVLELLEREPTPARARVDLVVSPGVTAMLAAAAAVGAPLGHDFCAISLSDLLTPWPVIARRLHAAAAGDLVTVLYNPVSVRRREGLVRARAILLEHRSPATPVVIARNVGRDGARQELVTLAELTPERVDMLSLVIVGSTATRRFPRLHGPDWVLTPRDYEVDGPDRDDGA